MTTGSSEIGKPYAAPPGSHPVAAAARLRCRSCLRIERWSGDDGRKWCECGLAKLVHGQSAGAISEFALACRFFEGVTG